MKDRSHKKCPSGRLLAKGEQLLEHAGFDVAEKNVLRLTRAFILSMADRKNPRRNQNLQDATSRFDPEQADEITHAVVGLLGSVRKARQAPFFYSNPNCLNCRKILTEHERRLIEALAATRRGQRSKAYTQIMLICEGNPDDEVHHSMRRLADLLPLPRTDLDKTEISQAERTIRE